jgi:hypothetical protein
MREILFAVVFWGVIGLAVVPGTFGIISAVALDSRELMAGAAVWIGVGSMVALIVQTTLDIVRG